MTHSAPNTLILMTDQHRVDSLPFYGNPVVKTPALERVASEGTRFDRMYTPTAICTPARASLLTGAHPFRHGLLVNPERGGNSVVELPEGIATWGQTIRDAGYNVGHSGKWHVGKNRGPDYYGFDGEHMPGAFNPVDLPAYVSWLSENKHPAFAVTDAIFARSANNSGRGHLYAGRLKQPHEATFENYICTRALELLSGYAKQFRETGKPFVLTASWFGPHLPYLIPDEYYDMYDPADVVLPDSFAETFANKPLVQRRYSEYWDVDGFDEDQWRKLIAVYWGYVSMIDHSMGRLLDVLDSFNLWDKTNIVFLADHGEFTGAHRMHDKGPAMYEDIYRIPGLVRIPGSPPQARQELTSLIDITTTVLDLCGQADVMPTDGRSLVPMVQGEVQDDWRTEIIAEFHGHHFAFQQRMICDCRYKFIFNFEGENEFYDLEKDPGELLNLYDVPIYQKKRDSLAARLYTELVARRDPASSWMTFMAPIGEARVADVKGVADYVEKPKPHGTGPDNG